MTSVLCPFFLTSMILMMMMHVSPLTAFYQAIDNTHPLVLCDSLNEDIQTLLNISTPVFPDSLPETRCVAINVCSEQNHRGQSLLPDMWHHRSATALRFDEEYEFVGDLIYNHYSLQYARVPQGITLWACEPDFEHLRNTGHYKCHPDVSRITQVSGQCPSQSPLLLWPSERQEFLTCLSSLQHDFNTSTSLSAHNAGWGNIVYPIADERGRTQMIYYSFEEGFGCFESTDLTPGEYLSSSLAPNQIKTCPPLDVGEYTSDFTTDCVFSCPPDYDINTTLFKCLHKCQDVLELSCERGFNASQICTAVSPPRYMCIECPTQEGKGALEWNPSQVTACNYEDCPAGTYAADNVCVPCPLHTFSSSPAQTTCSACPYGTYTSAQHATSCTVCFENVENDVTRVTCESGHHLVHNLTKLEEYFNVSAANHREHFTPAQLALFCAEGHACLPCPPGTYAHENMCSACDYGTYQPNFQQTTCFHCSSTQTTAHQGSQGVHDCVCAEGFE